MCVTARASQNKKKSLILCSVNVIYELIGTELCKLLIEYSPWGFMNLFVVNFLSPIY